MIRRMFLINLVGGFNVLLEGTHEGTLLFRSLEATMTELAGSIDELGVDLFRGGTRGVGNRDLRRSRRFLTPTQAPLIMMKSLRITP